MVGRYRKLFLAAVLGLAGVACTSSDDPPPEIHQPWRRTAAWSHQDVISFDNVAVGTGTDAMAWFTRRTRGETDALAYLEIRDGEDAVEIEVPTPAEGVVIPVAVATADDGWAAVAVTRDVGYGENTGLMAWTGRSRPGDEVARGEMLPRLDRIAPPASVSIGRSAGTTVVASVLDGVPLVWDTPNESVAWEASRPDLDLDQDLVSLRVVGDGERLVLAGVDADGAAHLWTSVNGDRWDPVASDALPREAGSVGLLAPLQRGRVAVGWLDNEDDAPFNATVVTIQSLDGEELTDQGRISADGGDDRIDVSGAALSPERRLVVVGAGLQSNGTTSPMVWVRDGERWASTAQSELVGRLDYQLRAVTTTRDDTMVGLVTALSHIDVESWLWHPEDSD
jgi:hypothetical protein